MARRTAAHRTYTPPCRAVRCRATTVSVRSQGTSPRRPSVRHRRPPARPPSVALARPALSPGDRPSLRPSLARRPGPRLARRGGEASSCRPASHGTRWLGAVERRQLDRRGDAAARTEHWSVCMVTRLLRADYGAARRSVASPFTDKKSTVSTVAEQRAPPRSYVINVIISSIRSKESPRDGMSRRKQLKPRSLRRAYCMLSAVI